MKILLTMICHLVLVSLALQTAAFGIALTLTQGGIHRVYDVPWNLGVEAPYTEESLQAELQLALSERKWVQPSLGSDDNGLGVQFLLLHGVAADA